MIIDTLSQADRYLALSPRFALAFDFLRRFTADVPVGRHEIAGDEVYASVQRHLTRPPTERLLEAHRRYIDIQYLCSGRELIYWSPLSALKQMTSAYDPSADAALYALRPDAMPVQVRSGQFVILFPEDGHAPSCAWDEPEDVLKVVVKVLV